MDEELLSSDLDLLQEACMAINAETQQDALNFFIPQDKDREAMQVLSPGGEDHDYFLDTKKLYHFADQGNASKAFTDNDWQPPVQHAESFQKETNSAAKCSYEELSSPFVGEDMQPIYNESEWQETLSINVRDPNISPQELGIHIVGQDLPENIFSNQPSSQFIPGKVSYTKEECVPEFLSQLELSSCTQGCVLKEELSVVEGQYSEGKHLSYVTSLYHGAYGKVDKCRDFVSGHEFIRKKIALDKFRPSEVLFPLTIKQTNIMKICGLIQRVEVDGGNVMEILMDNAGISLVEFVKNLPESETLSQTLIWDLTKQALEGLSMLHRERIIHLDIKPENLCVRENNGASYTLTITDFGSAMKANQQVDFVGWTPEYMAPESCRCYLQHSFRNEGMFSYMNTQITGKVDVFALGLTVLFLYQKKHVLMNLVTEGQNSYNSFPMEKKKLVQLQLLFYLAKEKDPVGHLISDECSTDMRDLLSRMLSGSADVRPTAGEALIYMKVREEVDQIMLQPAAPKPDILAPRRRITRGRHNPSKRQNYESTTDKGQLVTQPSCSSSEYTPKMAEVPVSRLCLPKSINSLPDNEPGPIKDRMLKQKLREKLNPYLKGKIWFQKETEANNPTPLDVKSPCWAYTQSPSPVAMDIKESCVMETGQNITQPEELGVTLYHQLPDTKPIQPSSPTNQSSNMVVLCGNIPNFDALVNI